MGRKKKDVVAEEQARYEEAQKQARVRAQTGLAVEDEPGDLERALDIADRAGVLIVKGRADGTDDDQDADGQAEQSPESEGDQLPAEPQPDVEGQPEPPARDEGDIRSQMVHRTIGRPLSQPVVDELSEQLQDATLRIRDVTRDKKEADAEFNDRIKSAQGVAIAAAEKLRDGKELRAVDVECVWDYGTRVYKEIAQDTLEVLLKRDMTSEELSRPRTDLFGKIVPFPVPEWVDGPTALEQAADDPDDEDDSGDSELSDDDGLLGDPDEDDEPDEEEEEDPPQEDDEPF